MRSNTLARTISLLLIPLFFSSLQAAEQPVHSELSRAEIDHAVMRWIGNASGERHCAVSIVDVTKVVNRIVVQVSACSQPCGRAIRRANEAARMSGIELKTRLDACGPSRADFSLMPVSSKAAHKRPRTVIERFEAKKTTTEE